MERDIILRTENINMHFGITHANKDVCVAVERGEIRGFAGENGSGKSTLMSIIAGIYKRTGGKIYLNGEEYDPQSPNDAMVQKIGIVVQELGVIDTLPNDVNIFLTQLKRFSKGGYISLKRLNSEAKKLLSELDIDDVRLTNLSGKEQVETRKMIELARALSDHPEILIIDETTQALSHNNRMKLYEIVKNCKKQGMTVLVISHDLIELMEMTDNITVLKDGEVVGTYPSEELTEDRLKSLMIGREVAGQYYRDDKEETHEDDVLLQVKNLTAKEGFFKDVSLELYKGEILALCGLSDSGIHDLGKALFGIVKCSDGSIEITNKGAKVTSAVQAVRSGMAYIPKDRDNEAMMLNASVMDNFCLPSVIDIEGFAGYVSGHKMRKFAEDGIESFNVKCEGHEQTVSSLSGGNKQKINLGRWMLRDTDIFIMDSPTRGVDVGVKAYIYHLMREAKAKGQSIIMISDELMEALGMADRILVMKDGRVAQIVSRSANFTEESIFEVMI